MYVFISYSSFTKQLTVSGQYGMLGRRAAIPVAMAHKSEAEAVWNHYMEEVTAKENRRKKKVVL